LLLRTIIFAGADAAILFPIFFSTGGLALVSFF
jgi:hypothetical protein